MLRPAAPPQRRCANAHLGGQLVGSGLSRYQREQLIIDGLEGHLSTMSMVLLPKGPGAGVARLELRDEVPPVGR
ncbi:MAG: hypothetical protein KY454_13360 [Actinobacteria bacterium]|nr:hypothetical protein [Actinomycetota bacterium]